MPSEAVDLGKESARVALDSRSRLWWLVVPVALLCVLRAAQLAWLADDAFISFRYARNLVEGLGLVYNAGEYVEGYTNLLWTLTIASAMHLDFAPESIAHVLGIACWLALSVVLIWWSWHQARATGRPFVPLAALLNLLLPDAQRWATGGLETSMFSLLTSTGLLVLAAGAPRRGALLCSGLVLALGCTARPDGVLFAALGVIYVFLRGAARGPGERVRDTAWVTAPLVVVGVALVTFKLRYYGELFPTAFYSKSALAHYYSQGMIYVGLFFQRNWFAVLFLPLGVAVLGVRRRLIATPENLLFVTAFLLFSGYVVHSAGDYMYARRLMPALPFLWLLFEAMVRACTFRTGLALLLATLLAALLPRQIYAEDRFAIVHGVANEWAAYPPAAVERARLRGELLGTTLGHSQVRGIFQGGMCMFGYYSQLPYLAEMTGLTQYSLAKKPLLKRGRVGHEKRADEAWLSANGIHLIFFHADPPLTYGKGIRHLDLVRFGGLITAKVWKYSDAVMDPLRNRPDVDFIPIEVVLAQAENDIARVDAATARSILEFLERYYLADAPPTRAPIAARLRQMTADKQTEHEQ